VKTKSLHERWRRLLSDLNCAPCRPDRVRNLAGTAQTGFVVLTTCTVKNANRRGRSSGSCTVCLVRPTNRCTRQVSLQRRGKPVTHKAGVRHPSRRERKGLAGDSALVRGDSAVEFRVIGDPVKQAPHANLMDGRMGSNGSTPRMEPRRGPVRGSAQRDNVLLSEGLAGDSAHAARRMVATGKCLRLCW